MTGASKQVSIKESFCFGWTTFRKNLLFFIKALLILVLFHVITAHFEESLVKGDFRLEAALIAIELLFQTVFRLGLIKISLSFYDQQEVNLSDLFSKLHLYIKYLLATLIYVVFLLIGLLLFVIPGIIWGIKFAFYGQCMVDENLGIIESFKRSSVLTKNHKLKTFSFFVVLILFNLFGAIIVYIYVFFVMPISILTTVFYYRRLLSQKEELLN